MYENSPQTALADLFHKLWLVAMPEHLFPKFPKSAKICSLSGHAKTEWNAKLQNVELLKHRRHCCDRKEWSRCVGWASDIAKQPGNISMVCWFWYGIWHPAIMLSRKAFANKNVLQFYSLSDSEPLEGWEAFAAFGALEALSPWGPWIQQKWPSFGHCDSVVGGCAPRLSCSSLWSFCSRWFPTSAIPGHQWEEGKRGRG